MNKFVLVLSNLGALSFLLVLLLVYRNVNCKNCNIHKGFRIFINGTYPKMEKPLVHRISGFFHGRLRSAGGANYRGEHPLRR